MLYKLGQKFLVGGIETEVLYINNGNAWVWPLENIYLGEDGKIFSCVSFEVLDEKGIDKKGNRAIPLNSFNCGVV